MTTWGELGISGVLDTNVLVYAHLKDSEYHSASKSLVSRADSPEQSPVQKFAITPQVLTELYAVITNPKRVTAPLKSNEAVAAIDELLALEGMYLLPYPPGLYDRTAELLKAHPVTGPGVFDVQLAATMLGNGIHTIYTYDRSGFERIEGIKVEVP